ncbi:MAG: hypothetical protein HGA62_07805 [Chlorobiaceae bacterium]|nr:hypothetical protein [Chlorobiaceae bacterium]NTV60154.1 hypothetical protein [Chlorobiaceae bacterium]
MAKSKCNIACSIWRSFEILLFFVISVVGFNVLLKTTSQNSRSKEKSLSEKTAVLYEFSGPGLTFNGGLFHLNGYLAPRHHDTPAQQAIPGSPLCPVALHQLHFTDPLYTPSIDNAFLSGNLALPLPANLLQQNAVLLM